MERNLAMELDELRKEVAELKEATNWNFSSATATAALKAKQEDGRLLQGKLPEGLIFAEAIETFRDELTKYCREEGITGGIAHFGYFDAGSEMGGEGSMWTYYKRADELISLIKNGIAEKVLACIGNSDRLNILLALLNQPRTVAGLVEDCGYNSSGQVYHHLRPLTNADLVFEDKNSTTKGVYKVRPHRVQDIITLLAAIDGMVSTQYTQGNWDE